MKISFIDFLRSFPGKKDEKFRQRFSIFMICLIISVIIWFSLKLSDEYDTVIDVPLTFVHLPKNKVLTSISDSTLQVEVMEKGSNLFRILFVEKPEPFAVSLRFLPVFPKNGVYQGIIIPSLLLNELERDQNLLGKILSISPDTIYLSFEPERSKKVPVTAELNLSFEKQFMRYGNVVFEPDCVTVKGPERIVGKMDSVSLGIISLDKLDREFSGQKDFSTDSLNRFLTFSQNTVSYSIPVEKFTEAELEVPVNAINSEGQRIKTFPDKVKVFYNVALKDYPKVESGMISAVADMSEVKDSEDGKIRVTIESHPSFIRIKKTEPEKVEFIIIK